MSKPRQLGFTLIELLIVIVILTSLLTMAAMTIQTLTQQWQADSNRQQQHFALYKHLDLLATALQATVAYEVQSDTGYGFYFLGREEGFTGVTESGIYHAGKLAVYRVLKEPAASGKFALYYEEAAITNTPLLNAAQQLNFNFRLNIASNLDSLQFEYFGWPDVATRLDAATTAKDLRRWELHFDGIARGLQPEKIVIAFDDTVWPIILPDRMDVLKGRRLDNQ
ncbi:type II secretion system protein [Rheinheimera gaetbuli]